jgi:hypothetical protein
MNLKGGGILLQIKYILKSSKGASSVLVVLLLVVLVVFGLAAVTTSLSAVRLGERSGDWYLDYYKLDAAAERVLAVLDRAIYLAEQDVKKLDDQGENEFHLLLDEKLTETGSGLSGDSLPFIDADISKNEIDGMRLHIRARIIYEEGSGRYTVLEWKVENER